MIKQIWQILTIVNSSWGGYGCLQYDLFNFTVFEIFHNKVGKSIKVLMCCGIKEFGLYSGFRGLRKAFRRRYSIRILEEKVIQGAES